jgi:hypothetical protein
LQWFAAIRVEISVSNPRWKSKNACVCVDDVNKDGVFCAQAKFSVGMLE